MHTWKIWLTNHIRAATRRTQILMGIGIGLLGGAAILVSYNTDGLEGWGLAAGVILCAGMPNLLEKVAGRRFMALNLSTVLTVAAAAVTTMGAKLL